MLTLLIIESFFVLCGEHMGWDASPIATSLGISGSNAPPKVPGKKKKKKTHQGYTHGTLQTHL